MKKFHRGLLSNRWCALDSEAMSVKNNEEQTYRPQEIRPITGNVKTSGLNLINEKKVTWR